MNTSNNLKKLQCLPCIGAIVLFSFSGCQSDGTTRMNDDRPAITMAVCELHPTENNDVRGKVTFLESTGGIKIIAEVSGLSAGKHGFHIHEYGDCTSADAASAGGHFNPENKQHGAPSDEDRHIGDLGNIEVAIGDTLSTLEMVDTLITFYGKHSIIGRSVVVHANEDDLASQPTGGAGARVACGVIGIAK
jgi:superoxide dismutase, Cu-Zn family